MKTNFVASGCWDSVALLSNAHTETYSTRALMHTLVPVGCMEPYFRPN